MILTEEDIKNLPLITEDELSKMKVSKEELIEYAIAQFELEADKIDALYDWSYNPWSLFMIVKIALHGDVI